MSGNGGRPHIGILVVASNAGSTLRATLDRVPVEFRARIAEVIVLDDASHDDTFACGQAWAERPDTPRALVVRPGGQVLLSVPNFAHWYPRIVVVMGLFGYDRRGILDETPLRLFTRATLRRLVRASGFDILAERATGLPLRAISEADRRKPRIASKSDRVLAGIRPTLSGYQYILRLTPHAQETVHVEVI